MCNICTKFVIF